MKYEIIWLTCRGSQHRTMLSEVWMLPVASGYEEEFLCPGMHLVLAALSLFNVFVDVVHVTIEAIHVLQSNCVCEDVLPFALFPVFLFPLLTVFWFSCLCHLSSVIWLALLLLLLLFEAFLKIGFLKVSVDCCLRGVFKSGLSFEWMGYPSLTIQK